MKYFTLLAGLLLLIMLDDFVFAESTNQSNDGSTFTYRIQNWFQFLNSTFGRLIEQIKIPDIFRKSNQMPNMYEKVVDSSPEVNKPLSAKYKKSFAYPTFKDRAPQILQGVERFLGTNRKTILENRGQAALDELDGIISKIEDLKNQMQTDQPLTEISGKNGTIDPELAVYNHILTEKRQLGQVPTWFETEWLFAECYMYRRLNQIFKNSNAMQSFDPFMPCKIDTLLASKDPIIITAKILYDLKTQTATLSEEKRKEMFIYFLKCSLWGNKADLSLSGGKAVAAGGVVYPESSILVNDVDAVYDLLASSTEENTVVDIILDNAGYELYNDLCFADYLIWSGLVHSVHFHGKKIPWFVSDVTTQDFDIIFKLLKSDIGSDYLSQLVDSWQKYISAGTWRMTCESFWVLPYDYSQMQSKDPELYNKLTSSSLLIFKGDLNYRKLMGDIHWDPVTTFKSALRGFAPTNLVALRTIKADTVCGLKPGQAESISKTDSDWLITGKYAVIQALMKN